MYSPLILQCTCAQEEILGEFAVPAPAQNLLPLPGGQQLVEEQAVGDGEVEAVDIKLEVWF